MGDVRNHGISDDTPHAVRPPSPRCQLTRDMFMPEPAQEADDVRLKSMIEHGMSGIDWSPRL